MQRPKPTIKDIAARCGVSVSTVSKALNPQFRSGVNKSLRKRILREAEESGYRPNWVARAMINRRKHIIGLVYSGQFPLQEGNFHEMVSSLSAGLQKDQYYLLFLPSHLMLKDSAAVFERVDGFVLLNGRCEEQILNEIQEKKLPLVVLNGTLPGASVNIEIDDVYGSRILTNHFIQQGHEKIAFYIGKNPPTAHHHLHYSVNRRRKGYEEAMQAANLGKNINIIHNTEPELSARIQKGGKNIPTAIMVHSHVLAINLVGELGNRGVRIPRDVGIATFNDIYPIDHLVPPLTAVAIPAEEMGKAAAEQILGWINDPESVQIGTPIVFKPNLKIRASTSMQLL